MRTQIASPGSGSRHTSLGSPASSPGVPPMPSRPSLSARTTAPSTLPRAAVRATRAMRLVPHLSPENLTAGARDALVCCTSVDFNRQIGVFYCFAETDNEFCPAHSNSPIDPPMPFLAYYSIHLPARLQLRHRSTCAFFCICQYPFINLLMHFSGSYSIHLSIHFCLSWHLTGSIFRST